MSGLLASRPGQGAIRLLVGSHGLLLVQAVLTAWGGTEAPFSRLIAFVTTAIAVPALFWALVGDGVDHDRAWSGRSAR